MMILLDGMFSAGKSTFANKLIADNPGYTIVRGYCTTVQEVTNFLEAHKNENVVIDRLFILPFTRQQEPTASIQAVIEQLKNYQVKGYLFICNPDIAWQREHIKERPNEDYIGRNEFDQVVDYSRKVYSQGLGFWKLVNITTIPEAAAAQ